MDDHLTNILTNMQWTVEEQQAMAQMVPVGSEGCEEFSRAESDPPANGGGGGGSLPRQPSLLKQPSMPVALPPSLDPHGGNGAGEHVSTAAGARVKGCKTTYGEKTQEDFSVKSGVVKDGENDLASLNLVFASQAQAQVHHAQAQAQGAEWMHAQVQAQVHAHAQAQAQGAEWMRNLPQRLFQTQAQAQQVQAQAQAQQAQPQAQAQAAERLAESKTRRMNKHRESSQRSRAKKVEYTDKLEAAQAQAQAAERLAESKTRRMNRNRESSQRSRAKKVEYTDKLEAEVTKLKAEVTKKVEYTDKLEAEVTKLKAEVTKLTEENSRLWRELAERGC